MPGGDMIYLFYHPVFPLVVWKTRLSFITPTVIAGDKSLVNLMLSWHTLGQKLSPNATWADLAQRRIRFLR